LELTEREHTIINFLTEKGSVSVSDLSSSLDVSEVTIRSDLSDLEFKGFLSRTHGGAVPFIHPHIIERQNLAVEEKSRIAKAAAALVEDNDTIMIEAGTTAALIPRYLTGKRDIRVITNSVMAFNAARSNPALKITVTGGEYSNSTDSFIGYTAEDAIRRFNVKYAFIGTDGFSIKAGITTHYEQAAQIIRVMREKASKVILVSDSSKYDKIGVVSILPLSSIDLIITDSKLFPDAIKSIQNSGCKIEVY